LSDLEIQVWHRFRRFQASPNAPHTVLQLRWACQDYPSLFLCVKPHVTPLIFDTPQMNNKGHVLLHAHAGVEHKCNARTRKENEMQGTRKGNEMQCTRTGNAIHTGV